MLAIGLGGIEVAMAIAGEPVYLRMPEIWGVRLTGELPAWVSAKDVILEMLRRHGVKGGVNRIIEYHGPGLAQVTAMDRHVIANMGAELGATTTVFPADDQVRKFLRAEQREHDFVELLADADATYDVNDEIDLATLEPLIALPSSPGNVVPVREVAGSRCTRCRRLLRQPRTARFRRRRRHRFRAAGPPTGCPSTSTRAPGRSCRTSRRWAPHSTLIAAGARLHQSGCMGCIGMGQAPANGCNSLRTFPRNFPGRSGTRRTRSTCAPRRPPPRPRSPARSPTPATLPHLFGIDYPRLELPAGPA